MTDEARRVLEAVREAAGEAAATAELTTLYGAPAVVLTPQNPEAAEVAVVMHDGQWWVYAGDGPGFELWEGGPADWVREIRAMVSAAVAGDYEDGVTERRVRGPLHRWRRKIERAWSGTFQTPGGPISTHHVGQSPPPGIAPRRRFEPY